MREFFRSDIEDDEIRIIGSDDMGSVKKEHPRNFSLPRYLLYAVVIIGVIGLTLLFFFGWLGGQSQVPEQKDIQGTYPSNTSTKGAFVEKKDTIINNASLTILTPKNATPTLSISTGVLSDSTAILVVQAADIREDNGTIVGAFVLEGKLISKGQSKSGFCAIIEGVPTVGVADATPYLERAIETDGYFFRQYPLVVAGHVVENKPKGKSTRKALVELDGKIAVVMSHDRLTFHDFSEALVGLGVSNAIYLVGSSSFGFAKDIDGRFITFGERVELPLQNANFIVWR